MIYFDENKEAYGQLETLENWGKTLIFQCEDEIYEEFLQGKRIWQDNELVINPNYEAEQAQKEAERINKLTMTALDFIGVLQSFGLTLEQINAYLEANLAVKIQLTYCQNVYCGVAKSLMPITFEDITITADMVETAFRVKNGESVEITNDANVDNSDKNESENTEGESVSNAEL